MSPPLMHFPSRRRFTILLPVLAGLCLWLAAPAWAGPGSAIDQYLESVPTADGKGDSTRDGSHDSARNNDGQSEAAPAVGGVTLPPPSSSSTADSQDETTEETESGENAGRSEPEQPDPEPQALIQPSRPGFAAAATSGSGAGPLAFLLGASLVLSAGVAIFLARRKRAQ